MNWLLFAINGFLMGLSLTLAWFLYKTHKQLQEVLSSARVAIDHCIRKWVELQKKYPQDFKKEDFFDPANLLK